MLNKIREFSVPLIIGVIAAICWANLNYESYHDFVFYNFFPPLEFLNFHFLINDVFMYFFFATAGIEIVRSVSRGGALNPINKAVTPLIATLGGIAGPIIVFFALNAAMGSPEFLPGWGIGTATDIALAWLIARVIFGADHPAVNFLLLLAVADDAIGLIIIAVFYPDPNHPAQYIWLILVAVGVLAAFLLRKFGVRKWWIYLFVAGGIIWFGMFKCGVHPALASVLVIPFIPNTAEMETRLGTISGEKDENITALDRCGYRISPFVDLGLVFFGISNSGVQFSEISNLSLIVFLSLLIGKTCGVTLFTQFSVSVLKCDLPEGMKSKDVLLAAYIASIGLTVALFIAGSAFPNESLQGAAKMGALFSASAFLVAPVLAKIIKFEKVLYPGHQKS